MSKEKDLAALLDRTALYDLAMRYCRAVDRRDVVLLASVFHDDAHDEHGTAFSGPAAEFIRALPSALATFEVTQHQVLNAHFRLDGDRAEGELYFSSYHRSLPPEPQHVIVLGRYLDRYERRDGTWRISCRRIVWDSYQARAVPAEDATSLRGLGESGSGADDYSYRALELFGRGT